MLGRDRIDYVAVPPGSPPVLSVVIDTEEEFDWSRPLARENTSVESIGGQGRAQEIFAKHGVVPTYVIDYPVASRDSAVEILDGFRRAGACEIGAHLHPWVNPPHEEEVTPRNSYAGNLPPALERAKLERLTQTIERNFGVRPRVFRAGRWGAGPATGEILEDLGYEVDTSVLAYTGLTGDGGPDFTAFGPRPYWFGRHRRLLEVPQTAGFAGRLAGAGPTVFPALAGPLGLRLHVPGLAARLGLLERIRLTPEGMTLDELRRLTRSLLSTGCRVFTLCYHSPTLAPGNTPYVRDPADLRAFLDRLDQYLAFFITEIGGRPGTLSGLFRQFTNPAAALEPRSAETPVPASTPAPTPAPTTAPR